ncbi:MAG TPA: hypothetical protein VN750_13295 [Steroidobacteraceae bacterium]|nr:hypothetical protein [Steroidobacteraceae bacterium]
MPRQVDFGTVREIASALPGVVVSLGARGMSLKVRGKMLACRAIHPSAEEGSLVVRIDAARRAKLLAADPEVYYLTPHYAPHASVLIRVSRIGRDALAELLEEAMRFVTRGARPTGRASRKAPRD